MYKIQPVIQGRIRQWWQKAHESPRVLIKRSQSKVIFKIFPKKKKTETLILQPCQAASAGLDIEDRETAAENSMVPKLK